jgi:hypothetical protein
MKHAEFKVGQKFGCGGKAWLCTDKGTRVIVAIEVKDDWMAGPPYALAETVFDEDDMRGCTPLIVFCHSSGLATRKVYIPITRRACDAALERLR